MRLAEHDDVVHALTTDRSDQPLGKRILPRRGPAYSFHQDWHVADADRYIESILTGTVRTRAVLAAQSGAAAAGVRSYIADYLTRFQMLAGKYVLLMPAIIGSGARPGSTVS